MTRYRWAAELAQLNSPEGTARLQTRKPDYSLDEYLHQPTEKHCEPEKPHHLVNPWREALKAVMTTAMATLGFSVGGLPGGLIAGSLAGGSLSAFDSQHLEGEVNWGKTLLDGFLGAVPAGWRYGSRAAAFFVRGGTGLATVMRGALQGAVDGGLLGALQTGLKGLWLQSQQHHWDLAALVHDMGIAATHGAAGGAVLGGALNGVIGARPKANPLAALGNQAVPADRFERALASEGLSN